MIALLLTAMAAIGLYLVLARRTNTSSHAASAELKAKANDWLAQAGVAPTDQKQLVLLTALLFLAGAGLGWVIFGGLIGPAAVGAFSASFPFASFKSRRNKTRNEAAEAWPRMIEEMRLLCGSLGRPIPQALIEVGRSAPTELRPAFLEAEREWRISTDFTRMVTVLKARLADPTADAACETLLVAHALGGTDVDRRLAALAEDRLADLNGRKDARAKQAGVRFARRFVIVVPIGMALAGMSIGNGRAAYETFNGQVAVAIAIASLAACWWWAGRLIALPEEERVFRG